jgi:site-specific recombinase XerD
VNGVIYFVATNTGDLAIVRALTGGENSIRLGTTHAEAAESYYRLIVSQRKGDVEPRKAVKRGRKREKNRRFPLGWKLVDGVIHFVATNAGDRAIVQSLTGGKNSIRLGRTHEEASEAHYRLIVSRRKERDEAEPGTVRALCVLARQEKEFLSEIEVKKTRVERTRHIRDLERLFGDKRVARSPNEAGHDTAGVFLRAMHVQMHVTDSKPTRPVAVNREVRTWELLFQWARGKGLTEYNPARDLILPEEKPRQVLPLDKDFFKVYRRLDPPARFMAALIRFYGRRKVEILGLKMSDVNELGIEFLRGKDKDSREIFIEWDPRLRRMYERAMRWREEVIRPTKALRRDNTHNIFEREHPTWTKRVKRKIPLEVSDALILNRRGGGYTETGFNSAWRRAMKEAKLAGVFTFHDLRKACGQELERGHAQTVLAHDDPRTTNKIYRPGAIVINMNAFLAAKKKGAAKKPDKGPK